MIKLSTKRYLSFFDCWAIAASWDVLLNSLLTISPGSDWIESSLVGVLIHLTDLISWVKLRVSVLTGGINKSATIVETLKSIYTSYS